MQVLDATLWRGIHAGVVLDHELVQDGLKLVHVLLRHCAQPRQVQSEWVPVVVCQALHAQHAAVQHGATETSVPLVSLCEHAYRLSCASTDT